MTPLWIALAGGLGAGTRFVLDGVLTARSRRALPTATLSINVLGSLLLGVLAGWAAHGGPELVRAIGGVGFLGGFTTFSTASVELVRLARSGRPTGAAVLGLAMVVLSVAAAALGLALGGLL